MKVENSIMAWMEEIFLRMVLSENGKFTVKNVKNLKTLDKVTK